jgi:hypothetical protein
VLNAVDHDDQRLPAGVLGEPAQRVDRAALCAEGPLDLAGDFIEDVPLEERAPKEQDRVPVFSERAREIDHHAALTHA